MQLGKVAQYLNNKGNLSSSKKGIKDFFRKVEVDYSFAAALPIGLMPT